MSAIGIEASINGETVHVNAPPTERLTALLRNRLGLTGTKSAAMPAIAGPAPCW